MDKERKTEKLLLRLTPTDKKNISYHACDLRGFSGFDLPSFKNRNEYQSDCDHRKYKSIYLNYQR